MFRYGTVQAINALAQGCNQSMYVPVSTTRLPWIKDMIVQEKTNKEGGQQTEFLPETARHIGY